MYNFFIRCKIIGTTALGTFVWKHRRPGTVKTVYPSEEPLKLRRGLSTGVFFPSGPFVLTFFAFCPPQHTGRRRVVVVNGRPGRQRARDDGRRDHDERRVRRGDGRPVRAAGRLRAGQRRRAPDAAEGHPRGLRRRGHRQRNRRRNRVPGDVQRRHLQQRPARRPQVQVKKAY